MSVMNNLPRIEQISDDAYFGDTTAISRTMLNDFRKSPRHYQAWYVTKTLIRPEPENPRVAIGTVCHAALLQPDKFEELVEIIPPPPHGPLTSDGKKWGKKWDTFVAERPGKILLKEKELAVATRMRDAVLEHFGKLLLRATHIEQVVTWEDEASGLLLKCKPDALVLVSDPDNPTVIAQAFCLDLKTTGDVSPAQFTKRVEQGDLWMQDAHYCAGVRALTVCEQNPTGIEPDFIYLAVDETGNPPLAARLDYQSRLSAREVYAETLSRLVRCIATDDWSCPWEGDIQELSLKPWCFTNG